MISFRILVLIALVLSTGPSSRAQNPDCSHRALSVTVVDSQGVLVEGLDAADFQADFHGKPVKILSVTRDERPRRIVILLDASASMFGLDGMKWWLARASALHLAQSNLPRTSLALLIFREDIAERVDFAQGPIGVSESLKHVGEDAGYRKYLHGKTSLFDAILEGLKLLGSSSQGDVIYAVTDGEDNKSRTSVREAQRALEFAGIRLFALIPSRTDEMPYTTEEESGKSNLLRLAEKTGGMQLEPIESTPAGVTLDRDEQQKIAKVLELYYQPMVHPYLMEIELPETLEKPSNWRLRLADGRSREIKRHHIAYQQELMPCTTTASPK